MKFRQNIYIYKESKKVGIPIDILQSLLFGTLGEREVFMYLLHSGVTDLTKAQLIATIADSLGKHEITIGKDLKLLYRNKLVGRIQKEGKKLYYYIPKEVAFNIGKTVIPEAVEVNNTSAIKLPDLESDLERMIQENQTGAKVPKKPGDPRIMEIYDYYMKVFNKDERYKPTPDRKAAIANRLQEGFSVEECKEHIDFIAASPFHNGGGTDGKIYIDLKDIIFKRDKFHKRIDEMVQNRPKVIKKRKDEKAEEALIAERYRREEEEYFRRKKINATV